MTNIVQVGEGSSYNVIVLINQLLRYGEQIGEHLEREFGIHAFHIGNYPSDWYIFLCILREKAGSSQIHIKEWIHTLDDSLK
jgi:hypothetical protein